MDINMISESVSKGTYNPKPSQCDTDGVTLTRTPKMKSAAFVGDGTLTPTASKKIKITGFQYSVSGLGNILQTLVVSFTTSTIKILYVLYNNMAIGDGYGDSLSGLNLEGDVDETVTVNITNGAFSLVLYYEEL